ncbi:hypothetical protein [Streptomyces sp. NPDC004520]|uniref:hypothetical protein n=1 Tax=unclassified Streptomyces TaxID=2593676 RepID=UPI003695076E
MVANEDSATVTYVSDGVRVPVDRARVQAAASRMIPAHSETFSRHHVWFALVGTGLHYVVDLLDEAVGARPSTAETARLALTGLGFPVLALGYGDLLTKGHPAHRA